MDLVSKYELIEKIVNTDNEVLLQQVKHLLEEEEVENWENIPDDLRNSIQESIDQCDRGEVEPNEKVLNEMRQKYLSK